jgi:hypothetical protein
VPNGSQQIRNQAANTRQSLSSLRAMKKNSSSRKKRKRDNVEATISATITIHSKS